MVQEQKDVWAENAASSYEKLGKLNHMIGIVPRVDIVPQTSNYLSFLHWYTVGIETLDSESLAHVVRR